ncbi:HD domain-containing phosphohydrolase [Candidatus Bipolaricaulota bacterium]
MNRRFRILYKQTLRKELDVPDGMTIRHREEVTDRVDKRSTSLELLATSGSLEVTRQRIEAGKHFNLYAADEWAGFEFMYVLAGVMMLEDGDGGEIPIQPGDYLHHNGLPEKAYFRVETDVELLMVCTPPSFHLIRDDMQEMLEMARSVEEKDPATEGHCSRLERLAILTGERLRLPGELLVAMSYGAYLHDIGKVMVPDDILGKEDSLTDAEWGEMQDHPDYGADMLSKKEYLSGAADIVRAHHERFDGTGYPRGLLGEAIPIGARVVAVVDTYDAIISTRPYKKALAKEEAIRELEKSSGTQFDPRVVKAFLEVVGSVEERKTEPDAE